MSQWAIRDTKDQDACRTKRGHQQRRVRFHGKVRGYGDRDKTTKPAPENVPMMRAIDRTG
ncbi:hypothetical protein [Brasilonema sennae]|uniref:hypothetical protein n=1 Tax=Brasilonema sennae TaxID=1397703 RepID=UPI001FEBCFDE|nr:hypothetical protein [Brasilonema sennae]